MYICILKRKTGHILLKTTFDALSVLGFSNGLRKGFEKYPHPGLEIKKNVWSQICD